MNNSNKPQTIDVYIRQYPERLQAVLQENIAKWKA